MTIRRILSARRERARTNRAERMQQEILSEPPEVETAQVQTDQLQTWESPKMYRRRRREERAIGGNRLRRLYWGNRPRKYGDLAGIKKFRCEQIPEHCLDGEVFDLLQKIFPDSVPAWRPLCGPSSAKSIPKWRKMKRVTLAELGKDGEKLKCAALP